LANKPDVGALQNPHNNVRVAGEALKTVDFEVLKPAQSTTGAGMLIAISALLCSVPSFAFLTAAH
jgi:hypothetical protein